MHIDDFELTEAIAVYIAGMSAEEKYKIIHNHIKEYIDENLNESEQHHFCRYAEF